MKFTLETSLFPLCTFLLLFSHESNGAFTTAFVTNANTKSKPGYRIVSQHKRKSYSKQSTVPLSMTNEYQELTSQSKSKTRTNNFTNKLNAFALATTVFTLSSFTASPLIATSHASDFAGDTVTAMVQSIKDAEGNKDETLKVFEELAAVITEGKGLGGDVSYGGVQLERGVVADEDTTIYNPGLSLLTESEKTELVNAIIRSKEKALSTNTWSDDNQFGFEFLKQSLDPLHMNELSGYLGIVPFYAAVLYLGVMAIQQNLRALFPAVYILAALAIFAPVGVLIAFGP